MHLAQSFSWYIADRTKEAALLDLLPGYAVRIRAPTAQQQRYGAPLHVSFTSCSSSFTFSLLHTLRIRARRAQQQRCGGFTCCSSFTSFAWLYLPFGSVLLILRVSFTWLYLPFGSALLNLRISFTWLYLPFGSALEGRSSDVVEAFRMPHKVHCFFLRVPLLFPGATVDCCVFLCIFNRG